MTDKTLISGVAGNTTDDIHIARVAVLDRTRISCVIAKSTQARAAETILLIHGAGMNASWWTAQLRGLAPSLDVVAIDLPGHGASDAIGDASVDRYAEAAAVLLDAKRIGPVFVAGHSLGGAVALALAARRPDLIKGVVLISSCAKLPQNRRAVKALLGSLPTPIRKMLFFSTARTVLFSFGAAQSVVQFGLKELRKCSPETLRADVAAAEAMDLESAAQTMHVPTLILCGTQDLVTPVALSQRLNELISHSRLFLVPGAGHMLPLEASDLVNQALLQFVRGVVENDAGPLVLELRAAQRDIVRWLLDRMQAFLGRRSRRQTVP